MTRMQFGLILLVLFITALDLSIIGPALNTVGVLWAVSERTLSWGISSYILAFLIGMPLFARTSDVLGRRVVLLSAIAVFVAGSAGAALAPSFHWLVVGRALQGLGAGGVSPVVVALIGDTMAKERQASALGIASAANGIGFIVGPVLGGILLRVSWRLLFLINVPLGIALLAGLGRSLPPSRPPGKLRMDWPGLALLTTSFGSLALGINSLEIRDLGASLASSTVWPLFVVGLALLPLFSWHERRTAHPIIDPAVLLSPRIVIVTVMAFGAGLGRVIIQFIPRVVTLAFGVDDSTASLMLLPAAVAFVFASFVVGILLRRIGPYRVLATFGVLFTMALAVLAFELDRRWAFYAGSIAFGCGLAGISGPPLIYIMNLETTARDRGSAQALQLNVQLIGQLTGAALIGAFAASWAHSVRGYALVFAGLACEALAMTLLSIAVRRPYTAESPTSSTARG